jgi:hypothetical protein
VFDNLRQNDGFSYASGYGDRDNGVTNPFETDSVSPSSHHSPGRLRKIKKAHSPVSSPVVRTRYIFMLFFHFFDFL